MEMHDLPYTGTSSITGSGTIPTTVIGEKPDPVRVNKYEPHMYIPSFWNNCKYPLDKILKNIHNGAVMLLHGNSKDNVNVLDYCIKEIKKKG